MYQRIQRKYKFGNNTAIQYGGTVMISQITTKRKVILFCFLLCILFFAGIIASSIRIVCDIPTEVWALKPRTSIENVAIYTANNSDIFNFKGKYTDASGVEWYVVSGVLNYDSSVGLDKGFILAECCHWEFLCFGS